MKPKSTNIKAALTGSAAALAMLAGAASAEQLNFSVGLGPGSSVTKAAEDYAGTVKEMSDGELTVKVFPLELVSLPEMGPGIRDGLTDIGFMAAPYYPSEFAHTNFLAEQSMVLNLIDVDGKEGMAYAGAMSDYIINECDECRAEFEEQNHVYMGHISTTPYVMLCSEEVSTPAQLEGKRLRAGSAAYKRFAEHFGAVGVQMPASEAYEALSQGVLDCAMLSAGDLTNYRLKEVVNSVTLGVPGNVYGGTVAGNINRDAWQGLSDDDRAILLEAGAQLSADITYSYHALQESDLSDARADGKSVVEASPELTEELKTFVREDQELVAELFRTNYGVENAEGMQTEFREVLEKWVGLVKDVETPEDLGQLYWEQVFSKLDPATYSMD